MFSCFLWGHVWLIPQVRVASAPARLWIECTVSLLVSHSNIFQERPPVHTVSHLLLINAVWFRPQISVSVLSVPHTYFKKLEQPDSPPLSLVRALTGSLAERWARGACCYSHPHSPLIRTLGSLWCRPTDFRWLHHIFLAAGNSFLALHANTRVARLLSNPSSSADTVIGE